jgi:hypothetical protein
MLSSRTRARFPARPVARPRFRPAVEPLESRLVPYATSGYLWPNPELITLSFVPDGTIIGSNSNGYIYSNLFATFNAHSGWTTATWQKQILKAFQAWADQTNINIAVVPDSGAPLGTGYDEQGDPHFGDIRISGYNFGGNSNYLAVADMPPQINNYSIAGDVCFNTGQPWNIGSTYDLFSVTAHEAGHALGLYGSSSASAEMYETYAGVKSALSSEDIAGIRAIYSNGSTRSPDAYNAAGAGTSFSTAANLNPKVNPSSLTALVTGLDVTNVNQANYYTFTAPANTTGTLKVTVQSSGLSLLVPTVKVYATDKSTVLASASGSGQFGTTLTVTVSGIQAGQQFYVKVGGAEASPLGTGEYALAHNFGSGATPTASPPTIAVPNGASQSSGGAQPQSTNSNSGLLGGLLGGAGNLLNEVVGGLLGDLLGISTTFGLGAGHGDPASPTGDDDVVAPPPDSHAGGATAAPGLPPRLAQAANETFSREEGAVLLTMPPANGLLALPAGGTSQTLFAAAPAAGAAAAPVPLVAGLTRSGQPGALVAAPDATGNPWSPPPVQWSAQHRADGFLVHAQPVGVGSGPGTGEADGQPGPGAWGWLDDPDSAAPWAGFGAGTDAAPAGVSLRGPEMGGDGTAAALFALALAGSAFRWAEEDEGQQPGRKTPAVCGPVDSGR